MMMNMEPPRQELSLDESIKEVMQTLPPPIRNYLAQGKYTTVAKGLMVKYRLHIDQTAIVEREIMLLLMGIEDPAEFAKTLAEEAKLDQQTVNSIVQDVNAQIFVPLRDEMRKGPTATPQPTQPVKTVIQQQTQSAAAQPPRVNVPLQSPTLPKTPATAPVYAPLTKFPHLQNKIPKPSFLASSFQPPASRLLEDHEEPHIEFKKTAPPPPNLPGAIHHPPLPTPKPVPPLNNPRPPEVRLSPVIPKVEPQIPKPTPPPAKPYSSDPYHEPIDEK